MKKVFLSLAILAMAICANAQKNQYFWYQSNLMLGTEIAQIDSVTFGDDESTDTLHLLLPRTIIKTVRETIKVTIHDTLYINNYVCLPEGALPGEFSISPTKKVRFSKGNLQYNAALGTHLCADGTTQQGTWRFAENQWDYVGDATDGTVYENDIKCNNELISSTYNGWIDLFGNGTSGWNSGVSCYSPYDISTLENAYIDQDLTDANMNADWGIYNAISNGGNDANMWRTLNDSEWTYLLLQRENADKLYSSGTVNSITGLILLPDIWNLPNGATFTPQGSSYSSNIYNASQWEQMENAGAIFLPAAGWRRGNEHLIILSGSGSGHRGCYHASTTYTESSHKYNYMMVFYSDEIPFISGNLRYMGLSVRLVSDVVE